ncbi:putative RNA-directed DNA polymerase from transposon X-element [Trichonephila inaurata madagascariensis]|uniref:Putative RNA-directed DNA polymerase from transposon X-element n=1 Tax=Trichonephila inaurata madagascariensis TaxID=2747483 RepID=A0A8X6XMZ9_9ARAC|nr:putative RNA-directed DNA polymerase from transposon X-element [Trichonephila inaurata madagascariensis]
MDIDILKAKRKSLRAAFTVCCSDISNRIETETLGNNEVNALYKQLQDKFSRLETTQEEISDFLLRSEELKNTYQEDFSKTEEYRDKFFQICSLLEASQEKTVLVPEENISVEKRNVLSNQSVINETVYLQTLVLKIEHNGKELRVRTILDSGSQKSYISERVIKLLKLRPKSKQTIVHGLFGGRETSPHSHLVFDVYLKNFEDTYAHSVEVLSQKKICGFVPKIVDLYTLQELKEKNITLSDLEAKEHGIELFLGADVIGNILTGNSLKLSSRITVVQTKFGYTVIEKTNTIYNSLYNNVVPLHCANFTVTDLFRLYLIGLSSDIEKAFLQLSIIIEHRDYLRFFLPTVKETKIYRHCRVVFGICSPFQLPACIDLLLENSPARFDNVTQKLKPSFYVENCVTRVSDIQEQENFIVKAIEVMAKGCFNLRGWKSNVPGRYSSRSSGVTSLLGLLWDLDKDTLKCNFNYSGEGDISKRNVLAMVHKIFDPLGILSPTTLLPKILLQEAWKLKLKWDDPLSENIQETFRKWRDETQYLEKIDIPRYVEINENSELRLFVDACKSSYGACFYVRTITPLGVKIRLIRARSRVAPLKTLTIPRLELMACCIGARLVHAVFATLIYRIYIKIVAWSDSMVALWWLKNHGDWSVFVANRVKEINSLVPSQFWRHVPGELNPADLLSRGSSPRLFSDSLGWEGPSWLNAPPGNWPIDHLACETSEVEREKRKVRLCNLVAVEGEIPWYAIKFSNFQSIIRFVSWMLRFVKSTKKKREFREIGDLTVHEIEHAEKTLIKIVQAKFFPTEDSFPNINVITDEEDIKRVKTRITERSDNPEFIYPIILPGECLFTQRLIEYYHRQNCHAGTQILLGILRERIWIVRGRRVVRKIVRNCIRCQRYV